jgi:hypothetical protein
MTGLDLIPAFVEQAQQSAAAKNLSVTYHIGDMRALPWSNCFDRIVSSLTMNWPNGCGKWGFCASAALIGKGVGSL